MYSLKYWVQVPLFGTLVIDEFATCPGRFVARWESAKEFGGFLFCSRNHRMIKEQEFGNLQISATRVLEMQAQRVAEDFDQEAA